MARMNTTPSVDDVLDRINECGMDPNWFDHADDANPFQVMRDGNQLWFRTVNSGNVFRITVDELPRNEWPRPVSA